MCDNDHVVKLEEEQKIKEKKPKKSRIIFFFRVCWEKFVNWLLRNVSSIFRRGTHIITGYPGSGKTLLVNKIINSVDSKKYFFISNKNEFYQENVYHYDIWNLFDDYKQVQRLPTTDDKGRKLYGLIIDEINLEFNKRLNRSNEYNKRFVALVELLVTSRHQGINRIYFIGQKLELQDTQLQSLFKYWHNIIHNQSKAYYQFYVELNQIIFAPKQIVIESSKKSLGDEYDFLKFEKFKIKYYDLISYDTTGLSVDYLTLPLLKKEQDNFYKKKV